jgi:hypothetical protein
MEQITIIIPTLWRIGKFKDMLPVYIESEKISEIIIIDNDPDNSFDIVDPKIRKITKGENIYINPAWNWGVAESKTNYVALVNDDITISKNELSEMIDACISGIESDGYGIIGIDETCFKEENRSSISIEQMVKRPKGYGVFLFTTKSDYTPIPEDLLLWVGDDIQYYTNKAGKLKGVYIETKMTETIGSEEKLIGLARKDVEIYNENYRDVYQPKMMHQDLINLLIEKNGYKSYMEIGIRNKVDCFNLIECENKVSVDPNPKAMADYIMTSDQFFDQNYNLTFDIIFIDGSHIAVDVCRDILNSLGVLNPGGAIVMHDCSPPTEFSQREDHMSGDWHGSVWKAFVKFRNRNLSSKYKTFCVDSDWGLGVILDYDSDKHRMESNVIYDYENLDKNRAEWLGLVHTGAVQNLI